MKKKVFFMALASLFIGIQNVNAASTCSYSEQVELNQAASVIKANYEIEKYATGIYGGYENPDEGTGTEDAEIFDDMMKINILNISKDLYIEVVVTGDRTPLTYNYSQTTDGNLVLERKDLSRIISYTITIYSNHQNCVGDKLKTITLTTPKYNEWSTQGACNVLKDFYYCQEYTLADINITEEEFNRLANNQLNKEAEDKEKENQENENVIDNILDFFNKNKFIILGVIVVAGGLTTAIVIRNRRSKKL